jgi:DNA topoisomerase II
MLNKKQELDDLKALSEKDLWCQDLDEFIKVWDERLAEEKDVSKKIRGLGRRVSKKIGAGKGGKLQSRLKTDDDYAPRAPKVQKANPAKGVIRVTPEKSSQKFLNMFAQRQKPKPKLDNYGGDGAEEGSGMSDDDFAAVAATKDSRVPSEQPAGGRSKRAAAAKPKNWVVKEESDSDDDKLLGDVGDMVKGIGMGNTDTSATNGRVSLFAMSRRGSSSGTRPSSSSGLPKGKGKGKAADLTDNDETNYEMLAKPSPHKTAPAPSANLDSFLSDEDDIALSAPTKKVPVAKAAPRPKKALLPKKPATSTSAPKPITLSPAAKAYALKQNKMKLKPESKNALVSDDDDDDVVIAKDNSSPKPAARRPARAAAVVKAKKPVYIDSDDDEMDVDGDESAIVVNEDSEDFDGSD